MTTNSSGNATGLSIGTAGQALKVNSGANGFEFGTISSDFVKVSDVLFQSQVQYLIVLDTQQFVQTNSYHQYYYLEWHTKNVTK